MHQHPEVQHTRSEVGGGAAQAEHPCSMEKTGWGRGGPAGQQALKRGVTTNRAQSAGTGGEVRHSNKLPKAPYLLLGPRSCHHSSTRRQSAISQEHLALLQPPGDPSSRPWKPPDQPGQAPCHPAGRTFSPETNKHRPASPPARGSWAPSSTH